MSSSKYAIIIVGLLCLGVAVGAYFYLPGVVQSVNDKRSQLTLLDSQITEKNVQADKIKQMEKRQSEIEDLYEKSVQAIPAKIDPVLFMIQLEEMFKQTGLSGATFNVPVAGTTASSTTAIPATTAETATPAGSAGGTTARAADTTATKNELAFTAKVDGSYGDLKKILATLDQMSPWVALTSLEVNQADGKLTISIGAKTFAKTTTTDKEVTSTTFIDKAKQTFGSLKQYAAMPDFTQVGTYGKSNPFE